MKNTEYTKNIPCPNAELSVSIWNGGVKQVEGTDTKVGKIVLDFHTTPDWEAVFSASEDDKLTSEDVKSVMNAVIRAILGLHEQGLYSYAVIADYTDEGDPFISVLASSNDLYELDYVDAMTEMTAILADMGAYWVDPDEYCAEQNDSDDIPW